MKFGSLDGGDDGEYNDANLLRYAARMHFSMELGHLTEFSCDRNQVSGIKFDLLDGTLNKNAAAPICGFQYLINL